MDAVVAAPADTFLFARFSARFAEALLAPEIQRRITVRALVFLSLQLVYHAFPDIIARRFQEMLISNLIFDPLDHFFLFLLRNL